jgi:hypothetical protein
MEIVAYVEDTYLPQMVEQWERIRRQYPWYKVQPTSDTMLEVSGQVFNSAHAAACSRAVMEHCVRLFYQSPSISSFRSFINFDGQHFCLQFIFQWT